MNMIGVFLGAFITDLLGKATDRGNLGQHFAFLALVVAAALLMQLLFLHPERNDFDKEE
jgi:hypothetical protein